MSSRVALVSFGPAKRHKPEALDAWINEALQQYELLLTDGGHPQRIARTTLVTSISEDTTDGWPRNEFVALPEDFFELHRLALVTGTERVPLNQFGESDAEAFMGHDWFVPGESWGRPARFRLARYRDTDGTYKTIARLMPAADAVYTLELIYQPQPPVLLDESDPYDFFPGTSDFVVCSAVMSIMEYDGMQEPAAYKAVEGRRDYCAAILKDRAGNQARGGVMTMQQTPRQGMRFGRRR